MYPRFEKVDYEVLDGLVITTITDNYLYTLNKEEDLNTSLYTYFSIRNKSNSVVIISYIYPNTDISNLDVLEEGDIIIKVNNIEVNTIEDVREAAVKYTMIKKKRYIVIETALNEKILIDVNKYIIN